MSKNAKPTDPAPENPTYTDTLISTDHQNGILVFSTDRPGGQRVAVTLGIMGHQATVQGGQIWLRTDQTDWAELATVGALPE